MPQNNHIMGAPVLHFFGNPVLLASSSMACPACGYLPSGKSQFVYPPLYETGQVDTESQPVWGGFVLVLCPDCNSHWTFQDLRSNDVEKLAAHIAANK